MGLHGHYGLGEGLWHHGGGSWRLLLLLQSSLLLLFGPVVLNQLCMVLLLLPDLDSERQGRLSDTRTHQTHTEHTDWVL